MSFHPSLKWLLIIYLMSYSALLILYISHMNSSFLFEWALLSLNSSSIAGQFILDLTSALMITTVSLISFNVILFSAYYLTGKNQKKFYLILLMFIFSMILFCSSSNLMMMLIGWDGLGITSFLLVAFYQSNVSAGSSMITMFTNRIGDVMIILSMFYLMQVAHWNITQLSFFSHSSAFLSLSLLAAATKSAHLPFNLWLPEAMAAPTPVSALVHSSTLVTAGVILSLRLSYMLKDAPSLTLMMWLMGLLTTLMAGAVASYMKDPKKIIAYSTMSQLGMMSMSLALGFPQLALLHLITHAMFKALMFITMGVTIAMNKHKQMTMGAQSHNISLPTLSFKVAVLALNAFPFTAGFFSKDLILESSLIYSTELIIMTIYLPTSLTALYSIRLLRQTQTAKNKSPQMTPPTLNSYSLSELLYLSTLTQTFYALTSGASLSYYLSSSPPIILTSISSMIIFSMTIFGLFLISSLFTAMKKATIKLPASLATSSSLYSMISLWYSLEMMNVATYRLSLYTYKYMDKGVMQSPLNMLHKSLSSISHIITAQHMTYLHLILGAPLLILLFFILWI